jgi:bifunctional UDP-N-acetylglucosamine pyrophosphorylase / glucosamine-1-phosphate N-acetyltransferase
MKSGLAKALHLLAGRPLIQHVLEAVSGLGVQRTVVVLGHQADRVRNMVEGYGAAIALQAEQLGTGHAVMQAHEVIAAANGPVLVLCADTPLLTAATLRSIVELQAASRAAVTVMTAVVREPFGYGRIVRSKGAITRIVEEKDATAAQRKITEVNAGIYCFEQKFLLESLKSIKNNNAQGEYYLPDMITLARKKKLIVEGLLCGDPDEVMGVNTRVDLSCAEDIMRSRINRAWMLAGVTMLDPDATFIGSEVTLGRDCILYPNVRLEGKTTVGQGCTIFPGARIMDSTIGNAVIVKDSSVIEQSLVSDNASVGPFAHLRPGSNIGARARIGNFVEIKKSTIGEGSKANHLSYIGDATVGKDVNIGAGVITCNYDGFDKFPTIIEDGVFIGSDSQLVAPVRIGRGALIAAGSTITHTVPADALAISRSPQDIREGFAARRRKMKQKKK